MKKLLTLCSVLSVISLSSCSVNIHGVNNDVTLNSLKDGETQTVDLKGIEEIEMDIAVGDCNINVDSDEKAVINADFSYTGVNDSKARKNLENIELKCKTKGNKIHIGFIDSETGKEIRDGEKLADISTDIEITIPDSLKIFDISTDVGDIEINGFSGAFDISSDVGNVTAENLIITGKSELSTNVGDIYCTAESIEKANLELQADMGNIDFSLGKAEKSEIDIEADLGDITVDTQGKNYKEISGKNPSQKRELKLDDNCKIELKTGLGDIKIK